jgi:hypothetical protein
MKDHRHKYKQYLKTGKMVNSSSLVLEKGKSKILLVEPWPCTSKDELCMREGKWMLENECVNKHQAGAVAMAGGKQEYYKKKCAERYANKTEEYKQKSLIWRNKTKAIKCEHCNNVLSATHMSRHKRTNKTCLKIQQQANLTE